MNRDDVPDAVNDTTRAIIGAAIEVHKRFRPGLLERVYHEGIAHVLRSWGHVVEVEVRIRAS